MSSTPIEQWPTHAAAVRLLQSASLPSADLTDEHMRHFFYSGSASEPIGLVGVEFCGQDALLRSLVVNPEQRQSGLGSALVRKAEDYARSRGARSMFLLTTTAAAFFKSRGYASAERSSAPEAIRSTREFSELCPASSEFLVKPLAD